MSVVHLEEAEAVRCVADGADSLHGCASHLLAAAERLSQEARGFLQAYARRQADSPDPSALLRSIGALREHVALVCADVDAIDESLSHVRVALVRHPDTDPGLQAAALAELRDQLRAD